MTEKTYTSTVEEDKKTGDLVIQLPVELLNQMGWDENTFLVWDIMSQEDGAVAIRQATTEEIAAGTST